MANRVESRSHFGKVAYLLWHCSDKMHPLTRKEILKRLEEEGLKIDRKALENDVTALLEHQVDVRKTRVGKRIAYYIDNRMFDISEVAVLIDGVIASHSLSDDLSKALIEKLLLLRSVHEAREMKHHVYYSGRVKYCNNEVLVNVECINRCINKRRKVCFTYLQWNMDKKLEPRYGGEPVIATPLFLVLDDEKYYLIAWSDKRDDYRTFRLDKITDITMLEEAGYWKKEFSTMSPAQYAEQHFGMFGGEREEVIMEGKAENIGIIIDRLGTDIWIRKCSDDCFRARVTVAVSAEFFGWIDGLEGLIQISGPDKVLHAYQEHVQRLAAYIKCG